MKPNYERVAIDSLKLDPRNARKHDARNIKAIKDSLTKFGQQKPIVISKDGIVVAGNGTLIAAKELGWESIDVHFSALSGDEATAYGLADNRSAELAEWDDENLVEILGELDTSGWDLGDLGWSDEELKNILTPEFEPNLKDENDEDKDQKYTLTLTFKNEDDQQELFIELRDRGFKVKV